MLQLLFPAYCFHCEVRLKKLRDFLCSDCKEQLVLLEPENCYSHFGKSAFCFEGIGPAGSLLRELQRKKRTALAKDLSAFMALQFKRLKWPWPEIILPVSEKEQVLAEELSKWMRCPWKKNEKHAAKCIVLLIENRPFGLQLFAEKVQKRTPTAIYGLTLLTSL